MKEIDIKDIGNPKKQLRVNVWFADYFRHV